MTSLDPLLIPELEQERAPAIPVAQAGARYPLKAQLHALEVHRRLRNPSNAVADIGIDLRRHRRPDMRNRWFAPQIIDISPPKFAFPVDNPEIINEIILIVCRKYNQTPEAILYHCRKAKPSDARHIAMWLAHRLTDFPLCTIAHQFLRADHSVAYYAIHKIDARRRSTPAFAAEVDQLLEEMRR